MGLPYAVCPRTASISSLRSGPYVMDSQGRIDRGYFELCVLSGLRAALRAGDVWLKSSRRYSDPETYLIPKDRWSALRGEVCQQLQVPDEGTARLAQREAELERSWSGSILYWTAIRASEWRMETSSSRSSKRKSGRGAP